MTTMTSLQIQSFASLIDQLPIGIEESERIDRAANAACSSGSEDGSAEKAHEIIDGKSPISRRGCSKSNCHDCRQPVGPVACGTDEAMSTGLVYMNSSGFNGIAFPPVGEDATCMQMPEHPTVALAAGACTVQNGIIDCSFMPVSSPFSRDPASQQQQAAAGLRGFSSQEACAVVEPVQAYLPHCPEEASAGFAQAAAPPEYNSPDVGGAPLQSGGRGMFASDHTNANTLWPSWGQECPPASEWKYGAPAGSRSCGERLGGPLSQGARVGQGAPAVHGGGQVQVSIVSPGMLVVVV